MRPRRCFRWRVATSIDALAVGVTFAFLQVNIFWAVLFIGVVTFLLSAVGVRVGHVFGVKYKSKAELAGGPDPDPYGDEDPLRAPGDPGLKAAGCRRDTDGCRRFSRRCRRRCFERRCFPGNQWKKFPPDGIIMVPKKATLEFMKLEFRNKGDRERKRKDGNGA